MAVTMNKNLFALITTLVLTLIVNNATASIIIDPTAQFSNLDVSGDGIYETFEAAPFNNTVNPGVPGNARIANLEYLLPDISTLSVENAILNFSIFTNNAFHETQFNESSHLRSIDINVYFGNGVSDLDDADQTNNTYITNISYVEDFMGNLVLYSVDFSDFINANRSALSSNFLGISFVGLETDGGGWGPSVVTAEDFVSAPQLTLTVNQVSAPASVALMLMGLWFSLRTKRNKEC